MRHFTDCLAPAAAAVARSLLACALCVLLPFQAIASPDADDIVVVAVKGEVKITSGGSTQAARAGSTLELPASLRTGHDGSSDLRQGDTTIGVGPDTHLEFPAPTTTGTALERVVQPAGNAFYNVGPQGNRRLRVETPLLVAVIKGTQFNVAVTPDSSTISLFEGHLEVLATESGIAAVELNAGEIAVRRSGERTIRVLKLRNGGTSSAAPVAGGNAGGGVDATTGLAPTGESDPGPDLADDDSPFADDIEDVFDPGNPGAPTSPTDGGIAIDVDGGIDGLAGVPAGLDVGLAADLDLGAGEVGANVNAGIDLGVASIDAGVDAGVDLGAGTIDATVDAAIDLGGASVDTAVDAGVDLGAGTVDAAADVGVDLGAGVSADLGVDAGVDAGAGTIDAGVDADVAGADVGVDVGVDLTGADAGVDVDIGLLGTEIDLGLGGDSPAGDAADAPAGDESGGLLGGILRRARP